MKYFSRALLAKYKSNPTTQGADSKADGWIGTSLPTKTSVFYFCVYLISTVNILPTALVNFQLLYVVFVHIHGTLSYKGVPSKKCKMLYRSEKKSNNTLLKILYSANYLTVSVQVSLLFLLFYTNTRLYYPCQPIYSSRHLE